MTQTVAKPEPHALSSALKTDSDIAKLDFRARLKDLPVPVLIIAARYDRASLPRFAVQFTKYAPQARFVMLEHSGHFTFIEEPDGFFSAVRQLLEGSPDQIRGH